VIPVSRAVNANFKPVKGGSYVTLPVHAWDEDGQPMVWDSDRKCLRTATSFSNFSDLEDAEPDSYGEYVGIIPGGGWQVKYTDGEIVPVAYWTMSSGGSAIPAVQDDVNSTAPLYHVADNYELVPPGSEKND
jgi:hypothetical protein